ncbi:hypothetical protein [Azospirillum sp.]|uniref:hypothetical protein n=1 Tax=Azospirillum sp. TaxID=34012 RepID=UPI002D31EBD4|nr:hypothetical protein [Azospirillum sp.]HYD67546.1 hypothetical protein [Azospirillum sp.]
MLDFDFDVVTGPSLASCPVNKAVTEADEDAPPSTAPAAEPVSAPARSAGS